MINRSFNQEEKNRKRTLIQRHIVFYILNERKAG